MNATVDLAWADQGLRLRLGPAILAEMPGPAPTMPALVALLSACLMGCGDPQHSTPAPYEPFVPRATTDRAGARELVLLAEAGGVPGVASQATDRGRMIGALAAHGPRVHLGYGDYSDNTGPIANVSYSVVDHEFSVGDTLSTEEVLDLIVHQGYLFAADLDPRGHESRGSAFRLSEGAPHWQELPDIEGAVHTFAFVEFEGALYTGTGSVEGDTARVVRTGDAGQTWETAHATESPSDAFTRYTHFGATSTQLFVSGRIHATVSEAFAYTLSGGSWQALELVPSEGFLIPLVLGEELVVAQFSGDRGKGGVHLTSYVLQDTTFVASDPFPPGQRLVNWSLEQRVGGDSARLWVLSELANGRQTASLAHRLDDWETVVELPELEADDRFSAVCYLDNGLYLGTQAGALFVVRDVFELATRP